MTSTSTSTSTNEDYEAIRDFAAHGKRMLEVKEPCDGDTEDCPVWESVVDACFDDILPHAAAMAATIERYDAALRAAASYIDLLDKGKGPSDPAYLPLRDCYRNAVEDLGDAQNDGSNGR